MPGHQIGKFLAKTKFGQPKPLLIRPEFPLRQQHVKQPVVLIRGLWSRMVKKEFCFWLLA